MLWQSCAKQFDSSYNNTKLTIDSIVPANGTAGTPVHIYGTGFSLHTTDNKVNFNGVQASIDSSAPNTIGVLLAYAPVNGKTGNVSVMNGKDSTTGPVFTYAILAPHILSVSPAAGNPLITITITGNNFSPDAPKDIVSFNNVNAVVISADANSLQVQVPLPPAYPQESIPVTVTVNGVMSNAVQFQYLNYVPSITAINPTSGIAGTQVTITGNNFLTDPSNMTVSFNGTKAAFVSASANQLVVVAPNGTSGNISVRIIPYNVTANGPVFTYLLAPVISSISPSSGQAGMQVTLTGSNFVADISKDTIYFNGVKAAVVSATTSKIVVVVPVSTTGNVSLNANGFSVTGPVFTYTIPAPVISSISPSSGQAGIQVTLTGSNFVADTSKNAVYFNGVRAPVLTATATQIVMYAPNSTTGNVSVTSNGLTGTGPVFTYVVVPVITGISFTSQTNFNFIISGNNFDPTNSIVKFDGQVINGFTYSAGPPQRLTLPLNLLPSNLGNPVQVTVTVNNNASTAYPFLFNPNIVSATPDTVQATYPVTLQGTFFGNTQGTSTLKAFYLDQGGNKVYMSPSPTVVSWNTNTIQLTTPEYQSYVTIIGRSYFNIYFEVNVGGNASNIALFYMGH